MVNDQVLYIIVLIVTIVLNSHRKGTIEKQSLLKTTNYTTMNTDIDIASGPTHRVGNSLKLHFSAFKHTDRLSLQYAYDITYKVLDHLDVGERKRSLSGRHRPSG